MYTIYLPKSIHFLDMFFLNLKLYIFGRFGTGCIYGSGTGFCFGSLLVISRNFNKRRNVVLFLLSFNRTKCAQGFTKLKMNTKYNK